jgi:hypothetical protein
MLSFKVLASPLLLALTLASVFGLTCAATAQADQTPATSTGKQTSSPATSRAPAAPRRQSLRRHTLDDRVQQLAKSLDLNEKQQAGVKAVLERQQFQARQIQFDPNISGEERIGRFRALQDDTVLRIRALLDDEQKKKYDPLGHGKQEAGSSDKYVDQWMKSHQRTGQATPAEKKNPPSSSHN